MSFETVMAGSLSGGAAVVVAAGGGGGTVATFGGGSFPHAASATAPRTATMA
jgi:hypothetical protein